MDECSTYAFPLSTAPPAPVAQLRVSNIDETTFDVTWIIVFDGFTPITQARVEYFMRQATNTWEAVRVVDVVGATPTAVSLDGLAPFTLYRITVFLENMVGRSSPTSVEARTLSNGMNAWH